MPSDGIYWRGDDMFDFKGFDDWIPIFRGGRQTDSLGREHDGDEEEDEIAHGASFSW